MPGVKKSLLSLCVICQQFSFIWNSIGSINLSSQLPTSFKWKYTYLPTPTIFQHCKFGKYKAFKIPNMCAKAVDSFRMNLFSLLKERLPTITSYLAINTATIQALLSCCTLTAKNLLIMNLNPLFWVNELKEIGQRMKATGPIMNILWCITC